MGLFDGIKLSNFIPGLNTAKGILGGAGKLLSGAGKLLTLDVKGALNDFGGAVKSVGKGLSNDWLLGVVFPPALALQLTATGTDMIGAFGPDAEGGGRQQEALQHQGQQSQQQYQAPQPAIQGPNIGW